jgi:uncharacterized protein with HEPN domain
LRKSLGIYARAAAGSVRGRRIRFDATVRNLDAHPAIPWRMLIATRNQLIHGYLSLDNDILWSIVQTDVPVLLQKLKLLDSQPT